MPACCFISFGHDGDVAGPAPVVDCQDDQEAGEEAKQYLDGRAIEVWDGARLVAVIEIVSPGNKDRAEARRTFAGKCAAYLQRGIGLITIDIVTNRNANLHNELVQPRRSAPHHSSRNDAQSPDPAFTAAQYDRLALLYVIASVRSKRWLIPAYHAALDADIRNGHDDPLNFDPESFAKSLEAVVKNLQPPDEMQAADR